MKETSYQISLLTAYMLYALSVYNFWKLLSECVIINIYYSQGVRIHDATDFVTISEKFR